jgi:hypothetical protein
MLPTLLLLLVLPHSVALKWNPVSSSVGQVYYSVERQNLGAANWVKANASPTPCTSYLDTQVATDSTYLYRVASYTLQNGVSAYSAPVTAKVP